MNQSSTFYCTYPLWAKFRLVLTTIPFVILLIALINVYDIGVLVPVLLSLLLVIPTVWLDLLNFKRYIEVVVDSDSLLMGAQRLTWDEITEVRTFGPSINNEFSYLSQRSFYGEGVVIISNKTEVVVYSSARNFKRLCERLEENGFTATK